MEKHQYPIILTANHVSEILGVSKRIVYEIMGAKDFPLLDLGRKGSKRVERDIFFNWLEQKSKIS